MPRLYMDTDSLRADLAAAWNLRIRLDDLLGALEQEVDNLVSAAWLAPGSAALGNDFHFARETLAYRVMELDALLRNLEREISDWEETGSVFHRISGDFPIPSRVPRYASPSNGGG